MENWYKIAKIGEQYLKAKGVPETNLSAFKEYLDSLPDNTSKYLMKKFVSKNPQMTLEELKQIPLEVNDTAIDPIMEKIVNKVSQNKQEREWLRGLVLSGRFQVEDATKLHIMLNNFNKLDTNKKINEFKDDVELAQYITSIKGEEFSTNIPTEGCKLLSAHNDKGHDVRLYRVTTQEALDQIGGNAQWCVLTRNGAYKYEPFTYHCFVIDGEAEVLLHQGSKQIKDKNDGPLTSASVVNLIDPIIQELALVDEDEEDVWGDDDEGPYYAEDDDENDYKEYESTRDRIEEIKSYSEDEIYGLVNDEPYNFQIIPEDQWSKYIPSLSDALLTTYSELDDDDPNKAYEEDDFAPDSTAVHMIRDIDYNVLDYLGNYLKVNGRQDELNRLVKLLGVSRFNNQPNMTAGFYKKAIPEVLRTKEMNEMFNEGREREIGKWKERFIGNIDHKCTYPEFSKLRDDPEVRKQAYAQFKERLETDPQAINNLYGGNKSFKEKLVFEEPEELKQILTKGWIYLLSKEATRRSWRAWRDCPEEYKIIPEVRASAVEGVKQDIEAETFLTRLLAFTMDDRYEPPLSEIVNFQDLIEMVKPKIRLLLQDIANSSRLGGDFLRNHAFEGLDDDPEIRQSLITIWEKEILRNPYLATNFIYETENEQVPEKIVEYIRNAEGRYSEYGILSYLAYWIGLTEQLKNNPLIFNAMKEKVLRYYSLAKGWNDDLSALYARVPEEMREGQIKDLTIKLVMEKIEDYSQFVPWNGMHGLGLYENESIKNAIIKRALTTTTLEEGFVYGVPDYAKKIYKRRHDEMALSQEHVKALPDEPTPQTPQEPALAKSKDRLWSSAFNTNFIGKLS